ncbi:tRNA(His) guanylyltransferase Thg1 family protein [Bernardetia sp.]|uniref:tRNA(His) guanylyltransferase Thg1 family protein n=1 Tax=Bernardetia sp. TaxID=1937974 RepID=UPI0025C6D2D1|nr:tRNA(His) guanylyltransferase Thg1 family protein [Bernardetia sp.]
MKFDDLDKQMRVYETNSDVCILPKVYMVARIDGRNFTTLTKQKHNFEAPFDIRFRDMMIETVKHLMNVGFNVVYGYTESDEISLLFSHDETVFNRKTRKYNSILAGEASAKFSLLLNDLAAFDCRISQLPTKEDVVDYFRWRNEDAFRNALNAHCYWMLRKDGFSAKEATQTLEGKSVADKNELLFSYGINFNDLPNWQKRGIGIYWKTYQKKGINPITKEIKFSERRKLHIDMELEMKDAYNNFINSFLLKQSI